VPTPGPSGIVLLECLTGPCLEGSPSGDLRPAPRRTGAATRRSPGAHGSCLERNARPSARPAAGRAQVSALPRHFSVPAPLGILGQRRDRAFIAGGARTIHRRCPVPLPRRPSSVRTPVAWPSPAPTVTHERGPLPKEVARGAGCRRHRRSVHRLLPVLGRAHTTNRTRRATAADNYTAPGDDHLAADDNNCPDRPHGSRYLDWRHCHRAGCGTIDAGSGQTISKPGRPCRD